MRDGESEASHVAFSGGEEDEIAVSSTTDKHSDTSQTTSCSDESSQDFDFIS